MKNTFKICNKDCDVTKEFQEIIDSLNVNETLFVAKGKYIVNNLFLHSNMTLSFDEGVVLESNVGEEDKYVNINTRVAGINMDFYAAVLNIIDSKNVYVKGHATINGMGKYFYNKYWGENTKGGMREIYDKKGIRFLCDYDCNRVRNILVQNSSNVEIRDIKSKDSGFWNLHILYSHDILVDNVEIDCKDLNAPSTDGIDIDSSYNVKVTNCITYTNDDSICIKSGRDSDGLKTNIASHDIEISNCKILKGFGITIGSELSGGIYNVNISNITYKNTDCGFRIKSAPSRKGYIKNINVSNLEMENVMYPIHISLNWNPNYSNTKLPNDFDLPMKDHYYKIIEDVDNSLKNTVIDGITINNLNSKISKDYKGESRSFEIIGFEDSHINNFVISNSNFVSNEFGRIGYSNILFKNVNISVLKENKKDNDTYDNR